MVRKPRCMFCRKPVDEHNQAVVLNATPAKYADFPNLMPGDGWGVCGEGCPALPAGALVVYR